MDQRVGDVVETPFGILLFDVVAVRPAGQLVLARPGIYNLGPSKNDSCSFAGRQSLLENKKK